MVLDWLSSFSDAVSGLLLSEFVSPFASVPVVYLSFELFG